MTTAMAEKGHDLQAEPHRCQEASQLSREKYIPCNRPARKVVEADGAELRMCEACADHSKKNRGMKVLRDYGEANGETVLSDSGGNQPPDPLDEALAPYGDYITEAESWLDGEPVQNADQMKAVDDLLKNIKAAEKAVKAAEDSEAKPLYDAWKNCKARFTPTLTDLERIKKGLVSIIGDFKKKAAEEQRRREAEARAAAEKARRQAEEAANTADAGDIEAQRAAAAAQEEAEAAQAAASAASKEKVKGLRKVTRYEITDYKAFLHWIAQNDRDALTAFMDEYARRKHKEIRTADGLRVWDDQEAF